MQPNTNQKCEIRSDHLFAKVIEDDDDDDDDNISNDPDCCWLRWY